VVRNVKAISATLRCSRCQTESAPEARFCSFCGDRLASSPNGSDDAGRRDSLESAEFSADLFRKLVDVTNDAVHVVDPVTSRFLEVNQGACDRLGYTREEMLALRVIDVQTRFPDPGAWTQHVERVRKTGSVLLENVHRRKDGTTFPVEVSVRYVTAKEKQYFVAIARDITDRKHAEQQLRESEERFRLLTETVEEVYWIANADLTRRLYVSPAYEKIWGRSPQELIANPRSFLDSVHPDDRERMAAFFENRARERPFAQEYRIVRPDGSERWILDRGFPTGEAATSPIGIVGVAKDITARKLSEVKLRESEERYRKLFETCDDGVFIFELSGKILSANPAASRMHGYPLDELLALNIRDLTHPPRLQASAERSKRLESGETLRFEVLHRRKDGTVFPEDVVATPMRIGDQTFVLSFERDMTEPLRSREREKSLRDELSHAARLGTMGEMASGIAHELNQPLGALVIYAETARRLGATLPSNELQNALQCIVEQSLRAGEIIRRMRAFVKRVPPTLAAADLNHLVREVLALLVHDLRKHEVELRLELDERLPPVLAETIQIQQVIVNLARNAIEAMTEKPRHDRLLRIHTQNTPDGAQVSVIDNGCGIDPSVVTKLFEPFQTTKPNGMGIGLSICQTLVRSHGGSIGMCPNPDGGTIFYFTLPVVAQERP
jgi:PAS domain S-box-containing protein